VGVFHSYVRFATTKGMGKAYGAGSFRRCDYGCFAKCCGCQEHRMHCQMFLQVLLIYGSAKTTRFFLVADGHRRSTEIRRIRHGMAVSDQDG
jgi:hypothetical protein